MEHSWNEITLAPADDARSVNCRMIDRL